MTVWPLNHLAQAGNSRNLIGRHYDVLMVAPNAELGAPPDVFLLRETYVCVVDPDVEHVHSLCVLAVVAPDIDPWSVGLDHHGDPVEFGVTRMEDVSRHRRASLRPRQRRTCRRQR
jgi:hypothetical protein